MPSPLLHEGVYIEDCGSGCHRSTKRDVILTFYRNGVSMVWNVAEGSPITKSNVEMASTQTVATLDESFFLVRFEPADDRTEKKYCAGDGRAWGRPSSFR